MVARKRPTRKHHARSALSIYDSKRDFSRTSEPRGDAEKAPAKGFFVVQKHAARRLHFDFRLELDGVLKSWAVTRGPSLDPSVKRLAVRTEDHPVAYGSFEGTIPKGEYGGGSVLLWDRGDWLPRGDPRQGLANGMVKFDLHGARLKGGFALVRLKPRVGEKRENWLLIKERDEAATAKVDPVERWTTSITTGRDLDDIAKGRAAKAKPLPRPKSPSTKPRVRLPKFHAPQLATLVDAAPQGNQWIHEIKYDGYRLIATIAGAKSRLWTRAGHDWTSKFSSIATALKHLGATSAVLDGEAAVADGKGRTDFGRLQRALDEGGDAITYYVFDLLELGGENFRSEPLEARKARLRKLLQSPPAGIVYSEHVSGDGGHVLREACKLGLEGIVSKRLDKPYVSGRTRSWLKTKCQNQDEFVIGGYRTSNKSGRPFASLLVGEFTGKKLTYSGRVGTGFDERRMADLAQRFSKLARPSSPFNAVPAEIRRDARWVEPKLVAQIAYAGRTADGILRHPSFLSLRGDKPAREVLVPTKLKAAPPAVRSTAKASRTSLTSPDKVLFAEANLTKQSLADYFAVVAPVMLPHAARRPLSLVRCPDGTSKKCFFQKHKTPGFPPGFKSVRVTESDGDAAEYLMITDVAGLTAAAQVGALELHIWGSRARSLDRPDRLVFDLDPDESVPFTEVRRAAKDVRDVLEAAGLQSFPLVTGGKGVHVVVPLAGKQAWDIVKGFASALAQRLAADDPARFIATMSKAKRKGRIFVDWMRNERGSTAIAPYSPRARPSAAVACPLTWVELAKCEKADAYSMATVLRRVRSGRDPWRGYDDVKQIIAKGALAMFAD